MRAFPPPQVVHILNMTTAQVHSFQLTADENLHSLQKRIEAETKIDVANQELLQETGVSLDPRKPAAQCVLDGVVGPRFAYLTRHSSDKHGFVP